MNAQTNGGKKEGRFLYRDGAVRDVESVSVSGGKTTIGDTGTVATVGSIFRPEIGAYQYQEFVVVEVSTNSFVVAAELTGLIVTDTFYILKWTTQRVSSDGSQVVIASAGPVEFVLNGASTQVEEDTAVAANSIPLPTKTLSDYISSVRLDYSFTAVTDSAWVELVASTGGTPINAITLFDGGGFAMELGIGAALSEARKLLIPPGGFNGVIPIHIPANSRISIRAVGAATVDAGEIDINFMR